ncbi:hypothetical protein H5410_064667 [Solanum commersonii]|uniref:Uncharacterized protein n=1 Tax=Solanum commersonii TaxID=4109 RepID=A0A9J5VZE7_SOLCO|nr:hypothetical protein H5410_064667 [Solanum commersonii]
MFISTTHSAHQSHNASTHVAPQSGYTISTPSVVPSSGYQTLQGYHILVVGLPYDQLVLVSAIV